MKAKTVKYILGAIAALLIVLIVVLIGHKNSLKEELRIKEQIISDIGINTHMTEYLQNNFTLNIINERYDLSKITVLNVAGDSIALIEIIKRPVLVYRFHETDCQQCISYGLEKLKAFIEDKGVKSIIILAQYHDNYQFKAWCRANPQDVYTFNLPNSLLSDNILTPYFFIIHPDLTMGEFFILDKSLPALTNKYTKLIYDKYFD